MKLVYLKLTITYENSTSTINKFQAHELFQQLRRHSQFVRKDKERQLKAYNCFYTMKIIKIILLYCLQIYII